MPRVEQSTTAVKFRYRLETPSWRSTLTTSSSRPILEVVIKKPPIFSTNRETCSASLKSKVYGPMATFSTSWTPMTASAATRWSRRLWSLTTVVPKSVLHWWVAMAASCALSKFLSHSLISARLFSLLCRLDLEMTWRRRWSGVPQFRWSTSAISDLSSKKSYSTQRSPRSTSGRPSWLLGRKATV